MLAFLMLVQSVVGLPDDAPAVAPVAKCTGDADEIVICAEDPNAYRVWLDAPETAGPPLARTRVSRNKTMTLRAEKAPLDTAPVRRVMVDLTIDF